MSVDQTFHTPSFGDDEFEIPPLSYAPTAAASRCSGQGVYGNQVPVEFLKRKLNYDQIYVYLPRQEENFNDCGIYNQHPISHIRSPEYLHPHQQQQQHPTYHTLQHSNSPSQNQIMNNNNQYHSGGPQMHHQQQHQYQNEMMNAHGMSMGLQYENSYSESMQQSSMQHPQMPVMQQTPQNTLMGPPQQVYSTINQNQLGLQQIRMAMSHQGGSPPGSNHTSPALETSEDSDDSTPLAQLMGTIKRPTPEPVEATVPKAAKKPKGQKKKKKRDPNEPQKPVSAYALFFRDTQAAIKGQNPNASFGEVSKIVASMWDSLDVDSKNNYKRRTENAKKEYLKKLAAYRATLVSKAAESDSMYGNNPNSSPPITNSPNNSPNGRMMQMQKSPVYASVVDQMPHSANSMNVHPQNQQVWQMQSPQHMANNSPPHAMQGGNPMGNMHQQSQMSPQMQQPQMSPQMQQQPQMSPQMQQQPQMSPQMQQQPQMSPQLQQQPQMSPQMQQQPQMSPQQQMGVMNNRPQQMQVNSPQMCNSASNSPTYNQNMTTLTSGENQMQGSDMMANLQTCIRTGCSNPAIDSPDWDREYCSNECVVSHCKDVFATWVAQKQQLAANSYSTVK